MLTDAKYEQCILVAAGNHFTPGHDAHDGLTGSSSRAVDKIIRPAGSRSLGTSLTRKRFSGREQRDVMVGGISQLLEFVFEDDQKIIATQ